MVIQMQNLRGNGTNQAIGVQTVQTADYSRIVGDDESLHDALLEAIRQGSFVWANPTLQRTVISKTKPHGTWYKVHGTMRMPEFPPEAA